jgi:AhpD family alkylhydroperoxidase
MTIDYVSSYKHLDRRMADLGRAIPLPMGGFARLHRKALADGALSSKVKELMALAVSIATGCDGCIAYHVHDAVAAGADRDELLETVAVGLFMAGGPGSIYAVHALDAIEQFMAPARTTAPAAAGGGEAPDVD